MPASVLAAGFSSASANTQMNNHFNPTPNSFDTSFLQQPFPGYGKKKVVHSKNNFVSLSRSNRPPSPNTQRKQPAPMNPHNNAFSSRDPPPPPMRPSAPPGTLPAPMMPQYVPLYSYLNLSTKPLFPYIRDQSLNSSRRTYSFALFSDEFNTQFRMD